MAVLALVVAHDFDQTVAPNSLLSSSPTTPPCFSIPRLGLHDKVVQFRPAPDRWIIVRQVRGKPDFQKEHGTFSWVVFWSFWSFILTIIVMAFTIARFYKS